MSSSVNHGEGNGSRQESRQSFWLSVVRIFVLEVVVLLALSGVFVAYLNWSSEVTYAEFSSAGATPPPANPPVRSTKAHATCDRGA